jgi:CO/xanthine dehydrogenase FAD-binding subunit
VKVAAYHRPGTLDEALAQLSEPTAVVLAGGTALRSVRGDEAGAVSVVDLQALGLGGIEVVAPDRIRLGAMATLDDVARHDDVPELVRALARREEPSTLRTLATVGGCVVVSDPESELLAGLLVHEAVVTVVGPHGDRDLPLGDVLGDRGVLGRDVVVAVTIATGGRTAMARTARTPADRAIVAAVARRTPDGEVLVALTGVAPTAVLEGGGTAPPDGRLEPPGDFRGSSEYRAALARTLAARVREQVA